MMNKIALTFHHGKSPQPKHHPPSATFLRSVAGTSRRPFDSPAVTKPPECPRGVLNSLGSQLDLGGKRWKPWEGRLEENHRKSRKLQFWCNFDVICYWLRLNSRQRWGIVVLQSSREHVTRNLKILQMREISSVFFFTFNSTKVDLSQDHVPGLCNLCVWSWRFTTGRGMGVGGVRLHQPAISKYCTEMYDSVDVLRSCDPAGMQIACRSWDPWQTTHQLVQAFKLLAIKSLCRPDAQTIANC